MYELALAAGPDPTSIAPATIPAAKFATIALLAEIKMRMLPNPSTHLNQFSLLPIFNPKAIKMIPIYHLFCTIGHFPRKPL